jgi:hypothetical protein
MSNYRGGRVRLGAGWDATDSGIVVKMRPGGLWKLADQGRHSSGSIRPRRRRGFSAVMTPDGPRRHSSYKRSRGLNTYQDAERDIESQAARHTDAAIARELRRIVG